MAWRDRREGTDAALAPNAGSGDRGAKRRRVGTMCRDSHLPAFRDPASRTGVALTGPCQPECATMTPVNPPRPGLGRRLLVMGALAVSGTLVFPNASPAMFHADVKDHDAMTTPTSAPPQDLSATQALQRMLELIRGIHAVTDVTPDLMQRVMGKQVHAMDEGMFGFGQQLPGNWTLGVRRYLLRPHDVPQMELGIDPVPNANAAPVNACEPDYAAFAAALEGMGFQRHPAHGEHGRWKFDAFDKPGLRVEVYPMYAQAKDEDSAAGTRCVKRVLVR